jgi:hypothetical protein
VRLLDLNPIWADDGLSFTFNCPLDRGRTVSVVVDGPDGHKVTSPTRHFAALSLEPSVRGTHHGPNRPCGLHVIIKNGQLLPAN